MVQNRIAQGYSSGVRPGRRILRFARYLYCVVLLELAASLLIPIAGPVTQRVTEAHPAIDIACRTGADVLAAHDGVGRSSWDGRMGWTFTLKGDGELRSSYSHLKSARGSGTYKRGDVIGQCGNTGSWSSGPHLHFEVTPVSTLRHYGAFARELPPVMTADAGSVQSYRSEPASASRSSAASAPSTTGSLLQELRGYGITVDRIERCGRGNQLGAYNRAVQRLCLATSLDSDSALMDKVLTHEAVHVAQDCLAGLQNGRSASIAAYLRNNGGFSEVAIAKFFGSHEVDANQIAVATASLSPEEKQLEYEAYALQNQGQLVRAMLRNRCSTAQG